MKEVKDRSDVVDAGECDWGTIQETAPECWCVYTPSAGEGMDAGLIGMRFYVGCGWGWMVNFNTSWVEKEVTRPRVFSHFFPLVSL